MDNRLPACGLRFARHRSTTLRLAAHRPRKGPALAEHGFLQDDEAVAFIEREIPLLTGLEVAGITPLVGLHESILDERGTNTTTLQFWVDANEQQVPVRLGNLSPVNSVHDVAGAEEPREWSEADAKGQAEKAGTNHSRHREPRPRRD